MPRTCKTCAHPDRAAIDKALLDMEPFRHIAARFGTNTGTLQRHKAEHIPVALSKAQEAEEVAQGDTLLEQLVSLCAKANAILDAPENQRTALAAVREVRATLELIGKVTGELIDRKEVSGTIRIFQGASMEQLLAAIGGEEAACAEIIEGKSKVFE